MSTEPDVTKEEYEYLWRHFAFNAEQRLKAFNFFVVFAVFANGGVFALIEKDLHPFLLLLAGGFICALSAAFWIMDARSKSLIALDVPGLRAYEQRFPEHSRIFTIADQATRPLGYKFAFRSLFLLQFLFGFGVLTYSAHVWWCSL
jgi:hypothetical protein